MKKLVSILIVLVIVTSCSKDDNTVNPLQDSGNQNNWLLKDINGGLIAYYPFNGNANDESGNGNDATVHGPLLTTDRFGICNAAYDFDGIDDFIQTAASNFLDGQEQGSVSLWINRFENAGGDNFIFAYSNDSYGGSVYAFANNGNYPSNYAPYLFCKYQNRTPYILANTPIISNTWYHLVYVADGMDRVKIYIDGVEETTVFNNNGSSADGSEWFADINLIANYDHFLCIGVLKREGNLEHSFDGIIDDFRIYNRPLSNDEIFELYNEEKSFDLLIDIKPNAYPNVISMKGNGVVPVAILTTSIADGELCDFDATTVDAASLEFGPAGAHIVHANGHLEDVDNDGDIDMIVHFRKKETGLSCEDEFADISGFTINGMSIKGTDSVIVKNCD